MPVCRDDVLYWCEIKRDTPDFFPSLYREFADPVIQQPYRNSGIFLTPIDFRVLPGSLLQGTTRITVPLAAIDGAMAALTYVWEGQRIVRPPAVENLREAARRWTEPMIPAWFGRDRTKLFLHVPQVAVYPEHGILVCSDWVDRPASPALR